MPFPQAGAVGAVPDAEEALGKGLGAAADEPAVPTMNLVQSSWAPRLFDYY